MVVLNRSGVSEIVGSVCVICGDLVALRLFKFGDAGVDWVLREF